MKKKINKTFEEFCHDCCDRMYEPRLQMHQQCTGYLKLREMVIGNITPASLDEIKRWETNPTTEELFSPPDIKYMRFLHEVLRPFIIENWDVIKNLQVTT